MARARPKGRATPPLPTGASGAASERGRRKMAEQRLPFPLSSGRERGRRAEQRPPSPPVRIAQPVRARPGGRAAPPLSTSKWRGRGRKAEQRAAPPLPTGASGAASERGRGKEAEQRPPLSSCHLGEDEGKSSTTFGIRVPPVGRTVQTRSLCCSVPRNDTPRRCGDSWGGGGAVRPLP